LSWSCSDPDGDALTYDVYFGTTSNPTTSIATNQSATSIGRTELINSTTYYWKVVAKDDNGATTTGPVWNFTTIAGNNPPATPSSPSPSNGSTGVSTSPTLSWSCSDPDGDALTYDVYFGTSSNPTSTISTNQTATSIGRTGLNNNTTYYWKIIAKDSKGASTSSPVWSFTTIQGNPQGCIPSLISPLEGAILDNGCFNQTDPVEWHFDWTDCEGATMYDLRITWASGLYSDDQTTTSEFTMKWTAYILDANLKYKVRAMINGVWGEWSNERTFHVEPVDTDCNGQTITDIDGNKYNTVQIGTQIWMSENLKVTHYRNGETISNITDDTQWNLLTSGAYCWYNNNIGFKDGFGALYNYYVVIDSRNICPSGWHIPSGTEWTNLLTFLGGTNIAGGKLKANDTYSYWNPPNVGATNESGFKGLPGGLRTLAGPYDGMYNMGYWWSSTEKSSSEAYRLQLHTNYSSGLWGYHWKKDGLSVRCIKD
jgi:uncharacterized protein (TIGR02145 family)